MRNAAATCLAVAAAAVGCSEDGADLSDAGAPYPPTFLCRAPREVEDGLFVPADSVPEALRGRPACHSVRGLAHYHASLAPGEQVRVATMGDVLTYDSCRSPRDCQPSRAQANLGDAPIDVFLAVSPEHDVLFRVQNLPSWCDDAPNLVEGDIVDVDTRMGPAAAFDCDDGPVAGLTAHRVVIPPDRALYAEAPGASLALLPECPGDGLSCPASGTHQLVAAPRGPRATTAFLYTGRSSPSGAGRLTTLTTAFLAVPDHRRCDAAWQVDELPVLLRNQSLPLGEESLCGIGPALFYDVPLEESQELTVTGARVAFAASCDPNSCLGSVNRRVYWTGRGAGRVVVAATGSPGDVAFDVRSLAYRVDVEPTPDCDDLSVGPVETQRVSGGSHPVIPLPFPFSFFGREMNGLALNAQATAELRSDADGVHMPRVIRDVVRGRIPNVVAAHGAPGADDEPIEARFRGFGEAPGRWFTLEWPDLTLYFAASGERVTIQMKLFEETGVVELHYCTLGDSDAALGTGAGIGLSGPSPGRDSVPFGFSEERPLEGVGALVFTPR